MPCRINQKVLCGLIECEICVPRSFYSHEDKEKVACWSDRNELKPWAVRKSCNKSFYFNCDICNHEFSKSLNNIIKNTWCIYCGNQKLCGDINCNTCLSKSFYSHEDKEKVDCWSDKNELKPWNVFKNTIKKYIFFCKKCKHNFKISPNKIFSENNWCCFCANKQLCGKKCRICSKKSFKYNPKSKFWSNKNKKKPWEIFKNTHEKIIFNCEHGHEFSIRLHDISAKNQWCGKCKHKTEKKLLSLLKEEYDEIIFNKKLFEKRYIYDFYIPKSKIIIELDGRQHFIDVSNWVSCEKNLSNDIEKIKLSLENNMSIIHISQEDVYHDRNNWNEKLLSIIKKYENPTCLFINNSKNSYKKHIEYIKQEKILCIEI